jgi:hypothetical protein
MLTNLIVGLVYGFGIRWCYGWTVHRSSKRWPFLWREPGDRRSTRFMCGVFAVFWPIIVLVELAVHGWRSE